ncbi:hypothetical protein EMCG_03653 [[Emmonsia] crescens]|uniref:Uncharacterized protein n=1 Tax=[Emmonsia] crescens TaxID=73230 RepID=A0A0G2IZY9_9EURO|nr:hypothetical protein EMCG_03653 [Emmonsia crescens UAMH 3008]
MDKEVAHVLQVTRLLEHQGVSCCLAGTSALIYYGAKRSRGDWLICVPSEDYSAAVALLDASSETCYRQPPISPQVSSLVHRYARYKLQDGSLCVFFVLAPSPGCHITCVPENLERSRNNLPYPKLHVFAQSLIDMHDVVALCDLVDGMDLDVQWGREHLDLGDTNDLEWAERGNELIRESLPPTELSFLYEFSVVAESREKIWEQAVNGKEERMRGKISDGILENSFSASY